MYCGCSQGDLGKLLRDWKMRASIASNHANGLRHKDTRWNRAVDTKATIYMVKRLNN